VRCRRLAGAICVALLLAVVGCRSAAPSASPAKIGGSRQLEPPAADGPLLELRSNAEKARRGYHLRHPDRVYIEIYGHEDLSGEYGVDPDGTVTFSFLGAVPVAGLTVAEVAKDLTDRLSPDYLVNPIVNVRLPGANAIYVLGEVQHPKSIPYVSGLTVLKAIALAGGATEKANANRVIVNRIEDGEQAQLKVEPGFSLRPGDVVEVPVKFW